MSKTITHELTYDAPVEAVTAMLADPAFREEVCAYQRFTKYDVTVDVEGETKKVKIDQWQPTQGMPSFAKKIFSKSTNNFCLYYIIYFSYGVFIYCFYSPS